MIAILLGEVCSVMDLLGNLRMICMVQCILPGGEEISIR